MTWLEELKEDLIKALAEPCDCDCSPGAHWCILCPPHGAHTREVERAYWEALAKVVLSETYGERSP